MKTKSFLLFSTSVFAISLFLIVFHSQPPQSIQNIVTQTHQHIKDFQEKLRDVEASHLVAGEEYARLLGLDGRAEPWRNTTLPALVTYARGDAHALAVAFVRHAARLPYTVLLYNIGLKPYSLSVVSSYCNSSKCAVVDFDLSAFPSHVSDESIYAFRPLIIQHALSRVGGVIFSESAQRWVGSRAQLASLWARAAHAGLVAWPRRAAVTSLTHPRMFTYLRAHADDFLFVQMMDAERLLVAPAAADVMRPWIQCALTLDCIMPIGAQSVGCRFDKKPQYRYSGCHAQDASALSIVLGLRWGFDEARYVERAPLWRRQSEAAARAAFADLQRNTTDDERAEQHVEQRAEHRTEHRIEHRTEQHTEHRVEQRTEVHPQQLTEPPRPRP
ncbi:PREDICTED: uncharacterized protein LOC106128504 isoform X2 [Papilio xuthus]|uniref:Uncharacterized protein LOC106128504 isoform X2 n=1 Tax=Papilio xuthus TaxID=66420 RepID=A0A194Q3U8_PAPXU|nr:PREDICTED: uncharacterized protein LOC106128504 isoform X2 [Papilio xuthus]KPJ00212.1 hypothetical protein RR46_02999 [Papilio xuthus]